MYLLVKILNLSLNKIYIIDLVLFLFKKTFSIFSYYSLLKKSHYTFVYSDYSLLLGIIQPSLSEIRIIKINCTY